MQLVQVKLASGAVRCGAWEDGQVYLFFGTSLGELLAQPDVLATAKRFREAAGAGVPLNTLKLLAPVAQQEIWAAGVTYKRSKIAREEESAGAAQFYDKVYSAARPELFLKSVPQKVVAPLDPVRIRQDSQWNVPEPELVLVINAQNQIIGYTAGNDMSSRDIEGENPLYLPQAKIYKQSCAIGPVITLAAAMPKLSEVMIRLVIRRSGSVVFTGETSFSQFNRQPEDLVEYLTRESDFPEGVMLFTGTGIVPPDSFTLVAGDEVSISIDGIGTLVNPVITG
jgi:2-dehydro-3-deoxy-D-arabinonate dehydratase